MGVAWVLLNPEFAKEAQHMPFSYSTAVLTELEPLGTEFLT